MRTSFRIILNILTTWAAIAVNIVVSIILVPFLLKKLGIETYGLITLVAVLISFSVFTDLGLRASLSRNLAAQAAMGYTSQYNQLLNTGFIVYLGIGIILASMCILFSSFMIDLFKVSAGTKRQAIYFIQFYAGPSILLLFIKPVFISILSSNNRFDIINTINTGISIFRGLGILTLLSFTNTGLMGWAVVSLTMQFLSLVFVFHACRNIRPDFKLNLRFVKKSALMELFSTGKYVFLQQMSFIFRHKINPIILSVFLGPTAAAIYRPAESISVVIKPVINTLAAQLFPLTTGYHISDNKEKLKAILIRGTRYTLLLAIPVSIMFIIFPKPIIKIWLEGSIGQKYLITSSVLFYMAVIDLFLYAGGTQGTILLGMNKMKFTSMVSAAFTLLSFATAIFLVGFTSIGIVGVILPAVLTGAITRIIFILHTGRLCGITLKEYVIKSYVRPTLIFFIISIAAAVSQVFFKVENLFELLFLAFSISMVWVILCWFVGFDRRDKEEFKHVIKSIWEVIVKKPAADPAYNPSSIYENIT